MCSVPATHCLPGSGRWSTTAAEPPRIYNDTLLLPEPYFDHATPLSRFPREYQMTPAISREGEALRLAAAPGDVLEVDEPVVAVGSTESRNYGSWLFRILPKLLDLDALGPEAEGRALFLPLEAPWMREIPETVCPGRRLVAQDVTRVARLRDVLLPSLPAPENVVPPRVRAHLSDLSARARAQAGQVGPRLRRLYVSRRRWSETAPRRVLVNEADLVEALQREGFEEIFPEDMSFAQRVAAFADAALVVGPTGSGLFNTMFCVPRTIVIEIEPHGRFRAMHASLYRSLGLDHAFLRGKITAPGPAPAHPEWRVNVDSVRSGIAAALDA